MLPLLKTEEWMEVDEDDRNNPETMVLKKGKERM